MSERFRITFSTQRFIIISHHGLNLHFSNKLTFKYLFEEGLILPVFEVNSFLYSFLFLYLFYRSPLSDICISISSPIVELAHLLTFLCVLMKGYDALHVIKCELCVFFFFISTFQVLWRKYYTHASSRYERCSLMVQLRNYFISSTYVYNPLGICLYIVCCI